MELAGFVGILDGFIMYNEETRGEEIQDSLSMEDIFFSLMQVMK